MNLPVRKHSGTMKKSVSNVYRNYVKRLSRSIKTSKEHSIPMIWRRQQNFSMANCHSFRNS